MTLQLSDCIALYPLVQDKPKCKYNLQEQILTNSMSNAHSMMSIIITVILLLITGCNFSQQETGLNGLHFNYVAFDVRVKFPAMKCFV
jgi:hypothetical protein